MTGSLMWRDWSSSKVKCLIINRYHDQLTEQIKKKLKEIIEFCEAYSSGQVIEIQFIEYKQAIESSKLRKLSMIQD